ncbi:hypothetical protein BC629DRAFT_1600003 [Irpex lacteus]|nr:hypothetical protein BC629DRAFT_1600003 [Irpex lacteus]
MLSAVAARKARREAQRSAEPPSTPSSPPVQNKTKHEKPTTNSKPSSKRRLSQRASNKPESKKRRVTKGGEQGRYFAQDAFTTQQDIITIEDEDESGSSSEEEALAGEDERREFVPRTTRGWSPSAPLPHSSDDEALDQLGTQNHAVYTTGATPKAVPQDPILLSTWRPIVNQNIFDLEEEDVRGLGLASTSRGKLCLLRKGERLTLVGVYLLTIVHGSVALAGTELSPASGSHRVFAPWSSPLPAIECLSSRITSNDSPASLSSRLREAVSGADAVVVIQELRTGVEGLGRICRTFENVFNLPGARPAEDMDLEGVHYVETGTQTLRPFVVPPSWEQGYRSILEDKSEDSRHVYVVQGPKKTGKSSFARMLLNALLTKYRRVAFLECDLGQSEFTPGGMVALNILDKPVFGPSFSHPSIPYQAHYIGSTSPKDSPRLYTEAIGALLHNYNVDVQYGDVEVPDANAADSRIEDVVPLVVNTMGWTKGLGADLSAKILDIVQPSQIFNIDAVQNEDDWGRYAGNNDSLSASSTNLTSSPYRVHALQSPATIVGATRFTPADHRTLSLLSYFHAVFPQDQPSGTPSASLQAQTWSTSLPLCAKVPFEVSVKDAIDAIVLVGAGSEDVVPAELRGVINGSLVGLVSYEHGYAPDAFDDAPADLPYTQGSPPPSPTISRCHGLALVRSSLGSPQPSSKLQLLTPVPSSILAQSSPRVLVKGSMELPVWGWLDFRDPRSVAGVDKQQVPYLRWGKGEGAGAERRRARRNLMRQGLY